MEPNLLATLDATTLFEIEKMNRAIETCEDVEALQTRLKEMVVSFYTQREFMKGLMKQQLTQ